MKVGRNAPCPCGSGRKYKQCCLLKQNAASWRERALIGLVIVVVAVGLLIALLAARDGGDGSRRVWSEEHQHWHEPP